MTGFDYHAQGGPTVAEVNDCRTWQISDSGFDYH